MSSPIAAFLVAEIAVAMLPRFWCERLRWFAGFPTTAPNQAVWQTRIGAPNSWVVIGCSRGRFQRAHDISQSKAGGKMPSEHLAARAHSRQTT
jgi:hypothetical protein